MTDKAMTLKEELIKEIETTPISLLPEILHFVQSIKTKHPDIDFMEFAGMAGRYRKYYARDCRRSRS